MTESTTAHSETTKDSPKGTQNTKTEWNLMFYIVGDSGLSASMISQLKELTDAGFHKDVSVLTYFDPNSNGRQARIFDVNHRRKRFKEQRAIIGDGRDPFVRDIAEDCHIPALPQMPSALTLRFFLEYARTYYPAKNYMLFLMGHGVVVGNDAFLPDADDGSGISLKQLGSILSNFSEKVRAEKDEFHLVGFHSCSMSSVELAYELAGTANYMMGTQGTAFPGSWPYRQLLKKFFVTFEALGTGNSPELVTTLVRGLQDLSFFNSEDFFLAGFSADLSICRLDREKVNTLDEPLKQLAVALTDGLKEKSVLDCIQLAHLRSQSYFAENYTDLNDFCLCLLKECGATEDDERPIVKACKAVNAALTTGEGDFGKLVVFSDYFGPDYQFSNGLSIYFPWCPPVPAVMRAYETYKFNAGRASDSWFSFLVKYFEATQRPLNNKSNRKTPSLWAPAQHLLNVQTTDLLAEISDQQLLSFGPPPPHKVGLGGTTGPPDKVGLGASGPPDKVGLGASGPPDKVGLGASGPPDKVGLGPPDKVGVGLLAVTVIKNFAAPEDIFITSRPQKFDENVPERPHR